jgi:ketosteroid isomerase-like protein
MDGNEVPTVDPHALATDVDRLLSYEAIRQLAYRYALATDSRDIDALVALFVDDVRIGRDRHGRAALAADFDMQLARIGVSILQVTNHIIDFDDADHARGIVYCYAQTQQDGEWIVQQIQYRDRYERRAGRWLFVRRIHLLWYGADVLRRPLGLEPADYRAATWGKGELPEAFDTWGPFWERVGKPAPTM